MLNITKTIDNTIETIILEGRLDTNTSSQLEPELNELAGIATLIWDFEKLEYISSAGLRVLLSAQKKMNAQGDMKIVHVCEAVMEILEVTGFTDILDIEQ